MMQLFGGFGAPTRSTAYDDVPAGRRLARTRRRGTSSLPLLVHAILFGGSYGAAAMDDCAVR